MFIDSETGEVIEENNLPELQKELSLIVTDDILEKMEQAAMLEAQIKSWKLHQTEQIKDLMKKHGITSFKKRLCEHCLQSANDTQDAGQEIHRNTSKR